MARLSARNADALLLPFAFTKKKTTQTHKTLRVNEAAGSYRLRGKTYRMDVWKLAQLKPILTGVGEVGNCIRF